MRCVYFFICLVLGISLALTAATAEKSVIIVARSAAAHKPKTTAAPLYTSSPRPPVAEVSTTAAPTKAPTVIINAPPQLAVVLPSTVEPTEAPTTAAPSVIINAPPQLAVVLPSTAVPIETPTTAAPSVIINAPPQLAVEISSTAAPTEAPSTAAPAVIINAPPQFTATTEKQQVAVGNVTEPQPLQTPPTVAAPALVEVTPKQETPLQVTGFITKNGNIYEVVDKNGIGRIEGRQNSNPDTNAPFVCNYGAVVIYSDVPCEEVTNVHVGGVRDEVPNTVDNKEKEPAETQQSTAVVQQAVDENNSSNEDNDDNNNNNNHNNNRVDDTSSDVEASENAQPEYTPNDDSAYLDYDVILPAVVDRRRGNKQPANQRRRNGNRQPPIVVHVDGGNRRRQQAKRQRPQQQRRRQQNNRKRNQQQRRRLQYQQQLQQQQNRRRYQNGNRKTQQRQRFGNSNNIRRYLDYDYDYYERRL